MSDNGELNWDNDLFWVKNEKFVGLTGWLQDYENLIVGDLNLLSAGNVSTLIWITLENRPLNQSKTSLITLTSRAQNQGMIWDDIVTVHDDWGHSPTEIQAINVYLKLRIIADSIHVYPLDETGAVTGNFETVLPDNPNQFKVLLKQSETRTLWFGIEAFGDLIEENAIDAPAIPENYGLTRIYPNPFNARTVIEVNLPETDQNEILIYDINGRSVRKLKPHRAGGKQSIVWDGKDSHGHAVSSGVYFIKLLSLNNTDIKKFIYLR